MNSTLRFVYTLAAAAIIIGGCTSKQESQSSPDTQAIDTTQLAPPAAPTAADTTALAADTMKPVTTHTAVISTTVGDIEIELYGVDAPKTVKNFAGLAKKKYFEGIGFHRVIPGFMIQTGDPLSKDTTKLQMWGTGGESIYGKTFEDELDLNTPSGKRGYAEGTVAMANSGPNTNGSQFFIVASTQGAAHLTYNYTIFGAVRNGMDVVREIEKTGAQGETVVHPVRIKKVTVKEDAAATAAATTGAKSDTAATARK